MKKAVSYKHSKQREALFNLLSSTNTHPTAAWLYDQLRKDFPHLHYDRAPFVSSLRYENILL